MRSPKRPTSSRPTEPYTIDGLLRPLLPPIKARRRAKHHVSQLAAALANLRVTAGMTQQQLAVDAGVSLNSLRKLEQGDLNVNLQTLLKLIYFLNHDLSIIPKNDLERGRARE